MSQIEQERVCYLQNITLKYISPVLSFMKTCFSSGYSEKVVCILCTFLFFCPPFTSHETLNIPPFYKPYYIYFTHIFPHKFMCPFNIFLSPLHTFLPSYFSFSLSFIENRATSMFHLAWPVHLSTLPALAWLVV